MHNTDRTQLEYEGAHEFEGGEMEFEGGEFEGGELEFEGGHEFEGGEMEYEGGEFEGSHEFEGGEMEFEGGELEFESGISHEHEMELAAELLEVSSEQEMEQFLGNLFKKVARGVSNFARSGAGRAIGGVLKNVAKQALPALGSVAGNMLLPGVGGAIGGKLAGALGGALGLELEGLSAEDREFEVARRFVRLGGAATRAALRMPRGLPPQVLANRALNIAASRLAPGLIRSGALGGVPWGRRGPAFGNRIARRGPGWGRNGAYRRRGRRSPNWGGGYYADVDPTDGVAAQAGGGCSCSGGANAASGTWYRQGSSIVIQGA